MQKAGFFPFFLLIAGWSKKNEALLWNFISHLNSFSSLYVFRLLLFFHSGCLPGWVWGRSMCHTGVGRICLPSPTAVCVGCPVSPVTLVFVPTWRSHRCQDWGPIHALLLLTGSSVKRLLVRWPNTQVHFLNIASAWKVFFMSFVLLFLCPGNPNQSTRPSCKKPCSLHTNCANCTSQAMECMWCGSVQRCVDSTAYVISFPYGQCLEWQTGDCVGEWLNLI